MSELDRTALAKAEQVLAVALDQNLASLADELDAPAEVQTAITRSRGVVSNAAAALAPTLVRGRGMVLLVLASPDTTGAAIVPSSDALVDAAEMPTWHADTSAPGTDPIRDESISEPLTRQFAAQGVRGMLKVGGTAERILEGCVIVTGIAAWHGDELVTRHAGTLLEDTPLH